MWTSDSEMTYAELMRLVQVLVKEECRAHDFDSGLCRFCNARIEAASSAAIEPHKPTCAWARLRRLAFPKERAMAAQARG